MEVAVAPEVMVGALVSTVMITVEAGLGLPAASVWVTEMVKLPWSSACAACRAESSLSVSV